jgi:hypothetical protein
MAWNFFTLIFSTWFPPPPKKNLPIKDFEFHRIFVGREIIHKMDCVLLRLIKNVIFNFEKKISIKLQNLNPLPRVFITGESGITPGIFENNVRNPFWAL